MSTDWTPNFGGVGRTPPQWNAKRPLRIALLGDFGAGALSGRMDTGAALAKRKPRPVEFDTLEDALQRAELKLSLPLGPEGAPIEIEIGELESFHPDELYRNVELFSALASLRKRLNTPATFAAAAKELQEWAEGAGRPVSAWRWPHPRAAPRRARAPRSTTSRASPAARRAPRWPKPTSPITCAASSAPSSCRPPARTRTLSSPTWTRRCPT
jgi:type VI secretion system protein ImpC